MIKINNQKIIISHFPDNTKLFTTTSLPQEIYSWGKVDTPIQIIWYYESDDELISLMYITKHLRTHDATSIGLIMPYIPNARMDRVKSHTDIFTLKYLFYFIPDSLV